MLIGRRAAGRGVSKRSIQQDPWGVFQVGTGARAMVLMPNQGRPGIRSAGDEGQGLKDDLPLPLGPGLSLRCPLRLCCWFCWFCGSSFAEGRLTRCAVRFQCVRWGWTGVPLERDHGSCGSLPTRALSLLAFCCLPGLSALPGSRGLNTHPPATQTRPAPLARALHFLPCPLFHFGEGCRSREAARIMYIPATASHLRAASHPEL